MLQYRAEFDAAVTFTTGGSLQTQGFRVDVPHGDVTRAEIAELFVAATRLRDVGRVEISAIRIFAESTPVSGAELERRRFVELSHVISDGMATYPGLAAPAIEPYRTGAPYAEGTAFAFDRITMLGQTGTYLDSPWHRYEDGADLAGLPLERLAELPAVVVRLAGSGRRRIDVADLEPLAVAGRAVLLHTGADRLFGTPAYAADGPYLSGEGAAWLVGHGAALVGIDAANIDNNGPEAAGERPAHTLLLAAGIPIVEHLTNLADLPPTGARFTAAPPRISAFGTFPVRAYATVPFFEPHDHSRSAGWQPIGS
ncbi:MAG: cyclase family protein [Actinoplanes sp.]